MSLAILGGIIFAILAFYWFVDGLMGQNRRRIERGLEAYDDAAKKLDEADNARSGSDLDKRVRSKYRDR